MKFARFKNKQDEIVYGLIDGNKLIELRGDIFSQYNKTKKTYLLEDVKLLPPCKPSKIVAVGLNYQDHADEMEKAIPSEPMLFMKPGTSVIGHESNIKYPDHMSERVDYEGELAIVISREASKVREKDAQNYIFGYTCINDVTARDLQSKDVQFTRAKGFDSFAPIGPYIETDLDTSNLKIKTYLNGELRQSSTTSNLIFDVSRLVAFVSSVMTLLPGDIIATGTPSGIGEMKPGDVVEVEIEGIGKLKNYVV